MSPYQFHHERAIEARAREILEHGDQVLEEPLVVVDEEAEEALEGASMIEALLFRQGIPMDQGGGTGGDLRYQRRRKSVPVFNRSESLGEAFQEEQQNVQDRCGFGSREPPKILQEIARLVPKKEGRSLRVRFGTAQDARDAPAERVKASGFGLHAVSKSSIHRGDGLATSPTSSLPEIQHVELRKFHGNVDFTVRHSDCECSRVLLVAHSPSVRHVTWPERLGLAEVRHMDQSGIGGC